MNWKKKLVPETTNNITTAIINHLIFEGWSASRINTQGQWDESIQRWRKSKSRKGTFDILSCIAGRFVAIDIKKGNDKLSDDQIEFQNEVIRSGGIAIEISTFHEFLNWYNDTINTLKNEFTTISKKGQGGHISSMGEK